MAGGAGGAQKGVDEGAAGGGEGGGRRPEPGNRPVGAPHGAPFFLGAMLRDGCSSGEVPESFNSGLWVRRSLIGGNPGSGATPRTRG